MNMRHSTAEYEISFISERQNQGGFQKHFFLWNTDVLTHIHKERKGCTLTVRCRLRQTVHLKDYTIAVHSTFRPYGLCQDCQIHTCQHLSSLKEAFGLNRVLHVPGLHPTAAQMRPVGGPGLQQHVLHHIQRRLGQTKRNRRCQTTGNTHDARQETPTQTNARKAGCCFFF